MKVKELQALPTKTLVHDLALLREELRDMRFKVAQNQYKRVHEIQKKKRLVARMLTIINERKRNEEKRAS